MENFDNLSPEERVQNIHFMVQELNHMLDYLSEHYLDVDRNRNLSSEIIHQNAFGLFLCIWAKYDLEAIHKIFSYAMGYASDLSSSSIMEPDRQLMLTIAIEFRRLLPLSRNELKSRRNPTGQARKMPCYVCKYPLSHRHHLLEVKVFGENEAVVHLCPNCHEIYHLLESAILRKSQYAKQLIGYAQSTGKVSKNTVRRLARLAHIKNSVLRSIFEISPEDSVEKMVEIALKEFDESEKDE